MMDKDFKDYDFKTKHETIWTNFGDVGLPRNEFKQLKRKYQSDLKNDLKFAEAGLILRGFDFQKHYSDKQMFVLIYLWLEMCKFQNKLRLNQCVQIMQLMFKHLTPINQKILYVKITSLFDWVDALTHERLDRIKADLIKTADYTEEDFYKRYDFMNAFIDSDECWVMDNPVADLNAKAKWIANPTIRKTSKDEDLELIKNEEYVTAYRGFIIEDDKSIRFSKEEVEATNGFLKYFQKSSYGISYTLDKFVAHFFAFYGESQLRHTRKLRNLPASNIRAVVGKYKVRAKDIFAYNNCREEREIVLRNSTRGGKNSCYALLEHYEFFTDKFGNFDRTGGLNRKDNSRADVTIKDYAPDRKIMRVFN